MSYDSVLPNGQAKPSSASQPPGTENLAAASDAINGQMQKQEQHHLWLVTGPAGCGKTTIAEHLANALDIPYIEGDKVRQRHVLHFGSSCAVPGQLSRQQGATNAGCSTTRKPTLTK